MPKLHVLQDVFPYIQGGDDEVGGYSPAELRPWPEPERAPPRPQQLPWPCTDTTTASDREEADVTRVPKSRMRNVWRRSRSSGAMTSWKRISTSARATLQRGGSTSHRRCRDYGRKRGLFLFADSAAGHAANRLWRGRRCLYRRSRAMNVTTEAFRNGRFLLLVAEMFCENAADWNPRFSVPLSRCVTFQQDMLLRSIYSNMNALVGVTLFARNTSEQINAKTKRMLQSVARAVEKINN